MLIKKSKGKVAHTKKKLETVELARKADEAHQANIRKLEDEFNGILDKEAIKRKEKLMEHTHIEWTGIGRTD